LEEKFSWQISKQLLLAILNDQVSDRFVCELVWERLFYLKQGQTDVWICTSETPLYWSKKFSFAPPFISERAASIHLTRAINENYKQGLKDFLNFKGYKVNELFPRKTRRATVVNWLIFWSRVYQYKIKSVGPMPPLSIPPENPAFGHNDDPPIT